MDSKQKDFTISLVLVALGIYTTIEGIRIYIKASKAPYNIDSFAISPGLLPTILGALLLILSLVLMTKSLKNGNFLIRIKQLLTWAREAVFDSDIRMMVGGMVIMGIYAFLLIGLIPYYLSSAVYLASLMLFLRASSFLKTILVAIITIALVILLFQTGFNVSLP